MTKTTTKVIGSAMWLARGTVTALGLALMTLRYRRDFAHVASPPLPV